MSAVYTLPLEQINNSHVEVAGGKGASLGELIQAGMNVPAGFVVTRAAFDLFMQAADRNGSVSEVLKNLAEDEIRADEASKALQAALSATPMPAEVSADIDRLFPSLGAEFTCVRSSATCEDGSESAWAGQLNTYLGVRASDVNQRVWDCWLSIFSPPALAYGAAHGYGAGQFGVAVIVQTMIASEVAGIGFSVHPVTQEPDVQLIEAGLGQGEAIVSGEIVPDQYIVQTRETKILDRVISQQKKALYLDKSNGRTDWHALEAEEGKKQKLSDEQVLEYSRLLRQMHDHYGKAVDTEWAMTGGRFHIVQARPITTLAKEHDQELVDSRYEWQAMVRRPMSLLEVSIVGHWLDTDHASSTLGSHADQCLFVQDDAGIANFFLPEPAITAMRKHLAETLRGDREFMMRLLRRALQIAEAGIAGVEAAAESVTDMKAAGEYMIRVGEYTTSLPASLLLSMEEEHIDDPEVKDIAQALRSQTLYPSVERNVVDALAENLASEFGFSEPGHIMRVASWHELSDLSRSLEALEQRLEWVKQGKKFVYQCQSGVESIQFVDETGYLLSRIARQHQVVVVDDPDVLRGQPAWPGVHRGRARVVLAPDAIGQTIEKGEVLVSIQSSPALMPLLTRAGAIVTDEGGVACHAAIICRELKIPTLIGTGSATRSIKTGDLLEVDATSGMVRVLERI